MSYPTSSLIASTYNWPEALELLLLSVLNQTVFPNEVIIADDGSREDTKKLIEEFQQKFPIPLVHIWHEDNGFLKSKILNKAILACNYDYIIQIDGDIIMNKNFIKDHLSFAKTNQYSFGSRVSIKEQKLAELFKSKNINFNFFSTKIGKRFRAIRFPYFNLLISQNKEISSKLRGCNIAYWKNDALRINGYNEDFVGWGGEDYEFALRLHQSGVCGKRIKHAAIAYHIYHKINSKENCHNNVEVQRKSLESGNFFVANGIKKDNI